MGCRWKTVSGKRMRAAPVGPARSAMAVFSTAVFNLLTALSLTFVHASPALTAEDLRDATFQLWQDPELGYVLEARMSPTATPIYHSITPAEAAALEANRPTASFIARMFHPVTVEETLN